MQTNRWLSPLLTVALLSGIWTCSDNGGNAVETSDTDTDTNSNTDADADIERVDYDANTLTLKNPLTWTTGTGVALPYLGNAPDQGITEYAP